VVGGGVGPGVAGSQHDGQRLTGATRAVVGEDSQQMEAISFLPRRPGPVSGDGSGIMSQAGALLTETARITGLCAALSSGLSRWRPSRSVHDPGKTVLDLAIAVALGGDCLADVGVLRAEQELFGPVAFDPVVSRLVTRLAGNAPAALKAIGAARAAARQRAWALASDAAPGGDGALVTVDIDATIVTSCSEAQPLIQTKGRG
jgi:hypothetical protein